MVRYSVPRALLCALLFLAFLPVRSFAGCNVAIVRNISPTDPNGTATIGQITFSTLGVPAVMQRESTMERASDVLIYDDTAVAGGNCFAGGNKILLSYSGLLTYPSSIQTNATNFDAYDNHGASGLGFNAHSFSAIAANSTVTVVEIDVQNPGTPAVSVGGITASATGSAVRVKNLRFDATMIPAGGTLSVSVSATTGMPAAVSGTVGTAQNTIAPGAGVTQEGIGEQSSGDTLTTPAIFTFAENYSSSFRVPSQNASGVSGDLPTTATRIIYDLGTTLPWGVDVTFPALIQVGGANGVTLTLHSGGTCKGPAQCTAVYDTTASGVGVFDFTTTTALAPNTGEDGNLPAISVFIENPSGFGSVTETISMVPSHITAVGDSPIQILSVPLIGGGAMVTTGTPALSGISPNTAAAGSGATTLTLSGSNFGTASVVRWNGSPRPTTYISATQLTAVLAAGDLATAGSGSVSVTNGTAQSNAVTFSITAAPKSTTPLQYVLPHVISGGGYATKITIVNTSTTQNTVVLNFLSQAGATLQSTTYSMAPGATVRVAMTDTERYGAAVTKWATVGSQTPVLANVWYDYVATSGSSTVGNSVGFNDAAPMTDFSLPVEFEPGVSGVTFGKTVGLALANPNAVAATATVKLVDSTGTVVASKTVSLPAWGQTAVDLSQAAGFGSALPAADFVGSITVSATSPVSSIAVQDSNGLFSAVPVGAGRAK